MLFGPGNEDGWWDPLPAEHAQLVCAVRVDSPPSTPERLSQDTADSLIRGSPLRPEKVAALLGTVTSDQVFERRAQAQAQCAAAQQQTPAPAETRPPLPASLLACTLLLE